MEKQSPDADVFQIKMIETYSDMVYRLAFAAVKSRFDADDIHQEVFVRYLKNVPVFQNADHEKAWFLRVTINCCKNHWKSAWIRKITGLSAEEPCGSYEPDELDEDSLELIEEVKKLPEKYRIVIHLFYYEDMSIEAISSITGRKQSTVRTQLTRARELLKKRLEEEYVSG